MPPGQWAQQAHSATETAASQGLRDGGIVAVNNEWETFRLRDADVLQRFREIASEFGAPNAQLHIRLAEGHNATIEGSLSQAEQDPRVTALTGVNEPVAYHLQFTPEGGSVIAVIRPKDRATDLVRVTLNQNWDATQILRLLPLVREKFPHLNRADSIERILGPDIAQFYRAREVGLARLEQVAQDLIEKTDEYRRTLAQQADAKQQQLEDSFAARRQELDGEYRQKQREAEVRQKELDDYKASLDDRQSRHARRALRQDLQKVLEGMSKQFSLTAGTTKKRRNVHALFITMLVLAIGYVTATIIEGWAESYDLARAVRVGLGIAGAVSVLLLYVRWTDQWFRQHADEEFRLKRMGLDVDRASWVVETAMEWQHENQEAIPVQLLEQLSRGLFARHDSAAKVRHPMEELATAILSGASSLRLQIPGIGEVTLGPKGAKQVAKKIAEDANQPSD
jgi:hypothetical protein